MEDSFCYHEERVREEQHAQQNHQQKRYRQQMMMTMLMMGMLSRCMPNNTNDKTIVKNQTKEE